MTWPIGLTASWRLFVPPSNSSRSMRARTGVDPVRWTVGDLGRLGFPEHLRLIGNWGEIADAGVATSGIVPPLDVAEDRHPGLGLRCEPAACQQLAFQCGEEALAHGVVVGVTDRPHGWEHAGFPAAPAERQRCILATLVAVVDDIAGLALTDRHLQCRQHELGAQMRLHRPADDPTAERIEHDSEIEKPAAVGI